MKSLRRLAAGTYTCMPARPIFNAEAACYSMFLSGKSLTADLSTFPTDVANLSRARLSSTLNRFTQHS